MHIWKSQITENSDCKVYEEIVNWNRQSTSNWTEDNRRNDKNKKVVEKFRKRKNMEKSREIGPHPCFQAHSWQTMKSQKLIHYDLDFVSLVWNAPFYFEILIYNYLMLFLFPFLFHFLNCMIQTEVIAKYCIIVFCCSFYENSTA